MKILVITDKSGKLIGTFRPNQFHAGTDQAGCFPLPNQTLHEIDVPPEIFAIERGEDFHRAVELHMRKEKKVSG